MMATEIHKLNDVNTTPTIIIILCSSSSLRHLLDFLSSSSSLRPFYFSYVRLRRELVVVFTVEIVLLSTY